MANPGIVFLTKREDYETVVGWRMLLEISKSLQHSALRTDFENELLGPHELSILSSLEGYSGIL